MYRSVCGPGLDTFPFARHDAASRSARLSVGRLLQMCRRYRDHRIRHNDFQGQNVLDSDAEDYVLSATIEAVGPDGKRYVTDSYNARIQKMDGVIDEYSSWRGIYHSSKRHPALDRMALK